MAVTRQTLVYQAYLSSPQAPGLFAAHGIRPAEKCQVVWDQISLEDAEVWCRIRDLDRLVADLNAAAANGGAVAAAPAGAGAATVEHRT